MSTEPDKLEMEPPPDRVFYATGVLLDADDFRDEQTYHRGRLARALAYLHGSGTVAGLQVEYQPAAGAEVEQIAVNPGLAIDRIGRLVEVPRRACIRLDRWYQHQPADVLVQALHPRTPPLAGDPYNGVVVDVFLRFVACERGKTPAFAAGPYEALDPVATSRLRDGYELRLVPRPEDAPPLPANNWPDFGAIADPVARRRAVRDAIYAAWPPDLTAAPLSPEPVGEYVAGQDQTAIFLARLQIPAAPPAAPGEQPARAAGAVTIDDEGRLFVFRGRALAKGADLW